MLSKDEIKLFLSASPVLNQYSQPEMEKIAAGLSKYINQGLGGKLSPAQEHRLLNGITKNLQDNPAFLKWCIRLILELSENCASHFYNNIIIGTVVDRIKQIERMKKLYSIFPPVTIVINPTMRCNLKCRGCYAYNYEKQGDMEYELLKKVLKEARQLGVRFITLSGGEPLLYNEVYRMFEEFNDMNFLMYTNSTLIDEKVARKLSEVGNVMPAISVEGYEKETNWRRGKGIFSKTLEAMKNLKHHGIMFGISCTPTRHNADVMSTEEFYDFWLEKGILFAWLFTYVPVGENPDVKLMCTPAQRVKIRQVTHRYRVKKPLLLADFWNDGPCVGGCLSASRYLYITNSGNVQPCTFVHFYTHNVRNHSLVEILTSPFFQAIREQQPYSENLLRPCKIIDSPEVLRQIVKQCNAKPSYPGAEKVVNDPATTSFLDNYAREYKKLADAAWLEEFKGGKEAVVPFLGKIDIWSFYIERMKNARRDIQKEQKLYYKKKEEEYVKVAG